MKTFNCLVKRNTKMFFKDKGLFFTALITPVILLVLYATFLATVYKNAFTATITGFGLTATSGIINGCVSGQLVSSLLSVSCITVAFCSNMLMVSDKINGQRKDFLVSPVKKSTLSLSYYVATFLTTFLICSIATALGLLYIGITGWYLTFTDVLLIILDEFILVSFGTALSSIIGFFLSSQGQISAVGSIVSSCYGFICGAYMPISSFGSGLQTVVKFLPGTYGTSLLRNHTLSGVFSEMSAQGYSLEAINGIKSSLDCNISLFGTNVSMGVMYLILAGTTALLIGIYVLINKKHIKNTGN